MRKQNLFITLIMLLELSRGVRAPPLPFWSFFCHIPILRNGGRIEKAAENLGVITPSQLHGEWYTIGMTWIRKKPMCSCLIQSFEKPTILAPHGTILQGFIGCETRKREVNSYLITKNDQNTILKLIYTYRFGPKIFRWNPDIKLDYWIFEKADDMSWLLVSERCGRRVFILSRTRVMDPDLYKDLLDRLQDVYKVNLGRWTRMCSP